MHDIHTCVHTHIHTHTTENPRSQTPNPNPNPQPQTPNLGRQHAQEQQAKLKELAETADHELAVHKGVTTALMFAIEMDHETLVECLLEAKADVFACSSSLSKRLSVSARSTARSKGVESEDTALTVAIRHCRYVVKMFIVCV